MYTDQFITERTYLTGVSPATVPWYRSSFKAFDGPLASEQAIVSQIAGCSESDAAGYLEKTGGELKPAVLVALGLEPNEAARLLDRCGRNLRAAIASMRGDG